MQPYIYKKIEHKDYDNSKIHISNKFLFLVVLVVVKILTSYISNNTYYN
jgi:hypothetical protein